MAPFPLCTACRTSGLNASSSCHNLLPQNACAVYPLCYILISAPTPLMHTNVSLEVSLAQHSSDLPIVCSTLLYNTLSSFCCSVIFSKGEEIRAFPRICIVWQKNLKNLNHETLNRGKKDRKDESQEVMKEDFQMPKW